MGQWSGVSPFQRGKELASIRCTRGIPTCRVAANQGLVSYRASGGTVYYVDGTLMSVVLFALDIRATAIASL